MREETKETMRYTDPSMIPSYGGSDCGILALVRSLFLPSQFNLQVPYFLDFLYLYGF